MSATKTVLTAGSAGVIAAAVAFTPSWEGMDKVAKRDMIGTGHPVTYCYGQTDEFGKIKAGTKFTKQECDEKLAESLPKYLDQIDKCIKVDMPDKTKASLLDAAYNAGPAAVCRSPMVAKMNAGDLEAGCHAFAGWYVRSDGVIRSGLIDRRSGEDHGDHRKSEKGLCLEGLREHEPPVEKAAEVKTKFDPRCNQGGARYQAMAEGANCSGSEVEIPAPTIKHGKRTVSTPACVWWKKCWFRKDS